MLKTHVAHGISLPAAGRRGAGSRCGLRRRRRRAHCVRVDAGVICSPRRNEQCWLFHSDLTETVCHLDRTADSTCRLAQDYVQATGPALVYCPTMRIESAADTVRRGNDLAG